MEPCDSAVGANIRINNENATATIFDRVKPRDGRFCSLRLLIIPRTAVVWGSCRRCQSETPFLSDWKLTNWRIQKKKKKPNSKQRNRRKWKSLSTWILQIKSSSSSRLLGKMDRWKGHIKDGGHTRRFFFSHRWLGSSGSSIVFYWATPSSREIGIEVNKK